MNSHDWLTALKAIRRLGALTFSPSERGTMFNSCSSLGDTTSTLFCSIAAAPVTAMSSMSSISISSDYIFFFFPEQWMLFQCDIYDEYALTLGSRKRDYIFHEHLSCSLWFSLWWSVCAQELNPLRTCQVYQWRRSKATYRDAAAAKADTVIFQSKDARESCAEVVASWRLCLCSMFAGGCIKCLSCRPCPHRLFLKWCWDELMNFISLMSVFDLQAWKTLIYFLLISLCYLDEVTREKQPRCLILHSLF